MTDRGTELERAEESLLRTSEALARNLGTITEQDWREAFDRCEQRVLYLLASSPFEDVKPSTWK